VPHAYPLFLDVSQRLVVIVGGGAVAARKAAGLIEAGGQRIRMISPRRIDGFVEHPGIEWIHEAYRPEHLEGAGLVFAATDSAEVNSAVVRDAQPLGVLVCRADVDHDAPGDFVTPASFRAGAVTVAVSAGSAALSVLIRDGVNARWDIRWSKMAEAMQSLRPLIRGRSLSIEQRRAIFRDAATAEAIDLLDRHGMDAFQQWLAARHPELRQ
jgi:precorrin-2 dehydrogenase/sirohydrochlorin ferrochelatase